MARRKRAAKRDSLEAGDDDAVDLLLRVASGPELYPELKRAWTPAPGDFVGEIGIGGYAEAMRLREEFQPLVQRAIEDSDQLYEQEHSARAREVIRNHGLSIKPIGAAITRSGRSSLVYARVYTDIHVKLSHGLLLLLDEQKPYGAALCRCKLPSCGRYYLARKKPRGGPANRTYCTPEHREVYRDSAERKAARKPK